MSVEQYYLKGNEAYESGDWQQAFHYYEQAWQRGHADATNNLADMYLHGEYVEKDEQRAFQLFLVAAKMGVHEAMFTLGVLCEKGLGIVESPEQALFWYKRAAQQQDLLALYHLGSIYYEGLLQQQRNISKALFWYEQAAQLGHIDAQYNLGYIFHNQEDGALHYEKGRYWYEQAASLGDALSCARLATIYEQGIGVQKSKQQAIYWAQLAEQYETK